MKKNISVVDPYQIRSRAPLSLSFHPVTYMSIEVENSEIKNGRNWGIRELGCFQLVRKSESEGDCLYRETFADKVRSDGRKKSRLRAMACKDQDHGPRTNF